MGKGVEKATQHIGQVRMLLATIASVFLTRATDHDASKMREPEFGFLDKLEELFSGVEYGTPEYQAVLDSDTMKQYLAHHYDNNTHHPEYYPNGVDGMCCFDYMEMLVDWMGAAKMKADGSDSKEKFAEHIQLSCERYGIEGTAKNILFNTARRLKFIE
jgi:hypothetical protein